LKIELGDLLLELMPKRKMEPARSAVVWTLGRLGTRVPLYGPLNTVIAVDVVSRWLDALLKAPPDDGAYPLAVMQMARRTDDRYRDVPEVLRDEVLTWLREHNAPRHLRQLVREGGTLDDEEQGRVFGEALPKGLRLR